MKSSIKKISLAIMFIILMIGLFNSFPLNLSSVIYEDNNKIESNNPNTQALIFIVELEHHGI